MKKVDDIVKKGENGLLQMELSKKTLKFKDFLNAKDKLEVLKDKGKDGKPKKEKITDFDQMNEGVDNMNECGEGVSLEECNKQKTEGAAQPLNQDDDIVSNTDYGEGSDNDTTTVSDNEYQEEGGDMLPPEEGEVPPKEGEVPPEEGEVPPEEGEFPEIRGEVQGVSDFKLKKVMADLKKKFEDKYDTEKKIDDEYSDVIAKFENAPPREKMISKRGFNESANDDITERGLEIYETFLNWSKEDLITFMNENADNDEENI